MASNSRDLVLRLVSDAAQFGRGFAQAERQASTFSRNVARAFGASGKEIDSRARAIDASLKGATVAIAGFAAGAAAAVVGVRKLADFAGDAIGSFSALQESANAANVVFGESSGIIERFGETAAESVGLAKSEFLELASRVGGQLQNLGLSTSEAARQTVNLTERAADLASVYGGSVADALAAIGAALRGERDPIERYAITLNDANVSARALADGLAESKSELDATDKALASISLILEQSDKVAGDFANTSDDVANKQRVLAAEFENAKAVIGEALLPAYEAGIEIIPFFIEALENLAPAFRRASDAAAENADDVAGFIERLPALAASVGDAGGAIGNFLSGIGSASQGVGNSLQFLTEFLTLDIGPGTSEQYQQAVEDFDAVVAAFDRIGENVAFGKLNRAIAGGIEPLTAYATVLQDLAQEGKLTNQIIADLGTVSGLSNSEQQFAILSQLQQAEALGLTREQVEELTGAYTDLLYAEQLARREADQQTIDRGLGDAAGRIFTPRVVADLQAASEQEITELDETLKERLAGAAETASEGVQGLIEAIADRTAEYAKVIDLFNEIELTPKEDRQSPNEILGNLEQQADVLSRFADAIGQLRDAGLNDLVGELVAAGPGYVAEAEALAGDISAATDIEAQLEANAELAADAAFAALAPGANTDKAGLARELGAFMAANVNAGFSEGIDFGPGLTRALTGADAPPSAATAAGARAYGGDVDAGRTYLVGEYGPELFTPPFAGRITPDISGSNVTTVNFSPTINHPQGDINRALDTQRMLLLSTVGRMVEAS